MQIAYTLNLHYNSKDGIFSKTNVRFLQKRGVRLLLVTSIVVPIAFRPSSHNLISKFGF